MTYIVYMCSFIIFFFENCSSYHSGYYDVYYLKKMTTGTPSSSSPPVLGPAPSARLSTTVETVVTVTPRTPLPGPADPGSDGPTYLADVIGASVFLVAVFVIAAVVSWLLWRRRTRQGMTWIACNKCNLFFFCRGWYRPTYFNHEAHGVLQRLFMLACNRVSCDMCGPRRVNQWYATLH